PPPPQFTCCVAEDDLTCESAGWRPLHVERGFRASETVVTLIPVTSGPVQIVDFFAKTADEVVDLIANSMTSAYNTDMPLINDCTVVVAPEHLTTLERGGVASKKQLAKMLWNKCNANLAPSYPRILRNKMLVDGKVPVPLIPLLSAVVGYGLMVVQTCLSLLMLEPLKIIPKFTSPESLHIVVAGAPAGKYSAFCPGFGLGVPPMSTAHLSGPVSRVVEDTPAGVRGAGGDDEDERVIMDPRGVAPPVPFSLAKRTGAMGKTIGFMDISKPKSDQVLDRVRELLLSKFPGATVKRYRKATFSRRAGKDLIARITADELHPHLTHVAVHDSARPLLLASSFTAVALAGFSHGCSALAVPVKATIKRAGPDLTVIDTPDRSELWEVQTPQVCDIDLLLAGFARVAAEGLAVTDDCSVVEAGGGAVKLTRGEYTNIKITTPEDLGVAEGILREREAGA
ncbi:hypothetical protein TeGR_g10842, partial [Tetraparma gracilis]